MSSESPGWLVGRLTETQSKSILHSAERICLQVNSRGGLRDEGRNGVVAHVCSLRSSLIWSELSVANHRLCFSLLLCCCSAPWRGARLDSSFGLTWRNHSLIA